MALNLFDFFRQVALSEAGVGAFTGHDLKQLEDAYRYLWRAFREEAKVDYSKHWNRIAYLMVYAPRHAVYWREHFRSNGYAAKGDVEWNSVGTGPASEVIGCLEGLDWPEDLDENLRSLTQCCTVYALDDEIGWRSILSHVEVHYQDVAGRLLNLVQTNDVRQLKPMTMWSAPVW